MVMEEQGLLHMRAGAIGTGFNHLPGSLQEEVMAEGQPLLLCICNFALHL